jgi:hypothetical protein
MYQQLICEELRSPGRHIVRIAKSNMLRWAGRVARMGRMPDVNTIREGKLLDKCPIGRPRRR